MTVACALLLAALAGGRAQAAEPGAGQPAGNGTPLRHYLSEPLRPADGVVEGAVPPSPVPARLHKLYRAMQNPVPDSPDAIAKGRLLFGANCGVCHVGDTGDTLLGAPPRELDLAYLAARSDGEIFYAIQNGIPGSAMLPWGGRLSDRDAWLLVRYLRHLGR